MMGSGAQKRSIALSSVPGLGGKMQVSVRAPVVGGDGLADCVRGTVAMCRWGLMDTKGPVFSFRICSVPNGGVFIRMYSLPLFGFEIVSGQMQEMCLDERHDCLNALQ